MEKIYGEKGIVLPEKLEIPKIDDQKLKELYHLLKPIVTIEEVKYLMREFTLEEMRRKSYIWNRNKDKREIVDPSSLETLDDFLCLHYHSYYGCFVPSICEILSQFPKNLVKEANTFEIIEQPERRVDVFRYPDVINNDFHLSKVRAYKLHK